MDAEAAPEPGDGPRRGSRSRAPSPVTGEGGSTPGQLALKAAYGYLEAAYESPAAAAAEYGVDRQLVNYYVRKLVAQGVSRSETSADPPSTPAEVPCDGDPHQVYCDAWASRHSRCSSTAGAKLRS